ncbi:lysine methyltransferase 5Ab isoform X1 [Nerophis lumbriciformis]|uniref:lysine methyltransferase 5Ab isoform X1 n=1 Tax=Nerophis lumbriciformis TaxID=546530 RepID=UPI002ADF0B8F|nr:N-lysine methyltransferase KMT5A-like isoform X1 [Nerophis lumbriciformis]
MAKGKKHEVRTDNKLENTPEQKTTTEDIKENLPAACKKQDCTRKAQSALPSVLSPSKSRSPLSDTSSMLIQEGNESDVNHVDAASKVNKDIPNETHSDVCKPKEGGAERDSHNYETKEDVAHQPQQKESPAHSNIVPAEDRKVSAAKSQSRNPRRVKGKKTENNATQNRKVTEFFPIRRSHRKTKGELKNEEHKHIDDLIKNGVEEGMQVRVIEGKGRGVFATRVFTKGDFVVEYHGDLLELTEAKLREGRYAQDPQTGCYMYYFQYNTKTYCVDATIETSRLGRLINHSKAGNCHTKLHAIDGVPHLILVASRDIQANEELLYDYGDRSKASILAHPWLKH